MAANGFLQYHEPGIIDILVLVSFFFFLSALGWAFNKLTRASLIGQILLGVLYGTPVGNILQTQWQETFMALGYIGLILIIFEGGLTIRLDLLKANFVLSLFAAAIGICTPIALCYLLLYLGFGYGAIETFIVGAALSTTSMGTTFVVMNSSADIDFKQTKIGTVLVSAALFDDVIGLVMVSVISNLGGVNDGGSTNIGWLVGRPIVASVAIGAVSPLLGRYAARPLYRSLLQHRAAPLGHKFTVIFMTGILCAHLVVCAYAGTSLLFGAFLAGIFLSMLPSQPGDAARDRRDGHESLPEFHVTFEKYISPAQSSVLEPLFFASIGFAIPFKRLWTGTVIWRGVVFSLLMAVGKASHYICRLPTGPLQVKMLTTEQVVVGLSVPFWDLTFPGGGDQGNPVSKGKSIMFNWTSATLLGMAMVARGEIGLLIIQLGLNDTDFLSEEAFLVCIWGIVLNTIIGPLSVGFLLHRFDRTIASSTRWGLQEKSSDVTLPPVVVETHQTCN